MPKFGICERSNVYSQSGLDDLVTYISELISVTMFTAMTVSIYSSAQLEHVLRRYINRY